MRVSVTGSSLDSLSVFPNSIKLHTADSTLKINYDINSGTANFTGGKEGDSVYVCYTVLPFKLNTNRFRRNPSLYDSGRVYRETYRARFAPVEKEEIFSSPGLQKTGNLSRGISFGNNQNVFVNSTLNLQIEGKLTEDVKITGVISDQNIPFQPQGNTQQLQQFDKVYIQLEGKKSKMIVGDVVMKNQPSYFLKYYRNVQGAQFEHKFINKDSLNNSVTSFGVAIAKGKFNSMLFAPGQPDTLIEGVQGPYRLRGPNGERFIIILANSEKIYLDGRLLKRGYDFDYTIDYNQAEITFTNNVIITRFSRIRVDFEFSDKNYSRTILNFSHYQTYNRFKGYVAFYQEKDNPRNPLTLTLSDADKEHLSQIGDTLQRAFVSGADSVPYNISQILYNRIKKKSGTADSINVYGNPVYIYAKKDSASLYQVVFTDLGPGNGTYYLSTTSTANGKVYIYDPNAPVEQRRFEPVRLIATPKQKNMLVGGGSISLTNSDNVFGEYAISKNDVNLYSPYDSEDDVGQSFRVGYENKGRKFLLNGYKWTSRIDYEYNQKSFSAIDRFRSPEFERDWSENTNVKGDNHILNVGAGIVKNQLNSFQYKISRRVKELDVDGSQQTYSLNKTIRKLQIINTGFLMHSKNPTQTSNWSRFNLNTYYNTKRVIPGVQYNMDKNLVKDPLGRVIRTAMYYDEMRAYVKNSDSIKTKFFTDYSIRKDKRPVDYQLKDFTLAHTANAGFSSKIKTNHEVFSSFTYRYLHYLDTTGIKQRNEANILGRIDWNSDFFKRHVRSEFTIAAATGRELKRQVVYVPVQGGVGNYIWLDSNNDGVQDLNEFVEINASYSYANTVTYIRSFVPTDTYFKAYTNTFNYRLDITAPRSWRNLKGLKNFISRFSNVSSWSLNKKITDNNLWHRFNPFVNDIAEQDILSVQKIIKSTLFFNRTNPQYGMDLGYSSTEQKQFLNQGFETRKAEELRFNSRVNFKSFYSIKGYCLYSLKGSLSDFLNSKNYQVRTFKGSPELSYQPANSIRLTLVLAYSNKENIVDTSKHQRVEIYEVGFDVKMNKVSRRTINSTIKYLYIKNNFLQTKNSLSSPLAYEMLEALQGGNNFTWNINWLERLTNGLQLTFSYEGRKAGTTRMVHIGRMQVSALF